VARAIELLADDAQRANVTSHVRELDLGAPRISSHTIVFLRAGFARIGAGLGWGSMMMAMVAVTVTVIVT
jgi:hypothetical protein